MNPMAPFGIGLCFGWLLEKAGLARYDCIVNVFRFRDFSVIQFLLSALVVGAIGLQALLSLGLTRSLPVPATFLVGNFAGGLVFGVGMALAGLCPGTIAAGIGEGRVDYLVPGSLGLIFGALLLGVGYARLFALLARSVRVGATLPGLFGVNPWLIIALLVELAGLIFYLVERAEHRRSAQ